MKKTLLSLAFLFASSIIAHAQWTTSGTATTTTNYVGVNTSSVVSMFQVGSGFSKFNTGRSTGANLAYGTSYIGFNAGRSTDGSLSWTIDGDSAHNGGGVIYGDVFGNIYLAPLASDGTSSKTLTDIDIKNSITLKIGADGIVYAKAVKVTTTGWPDYVFRPSYQLPALADVKTYIDQHQHLPEIPSAEEVEKNGLNVGEMNKLLMKKVEELTLYLIEIKAEKDKEIEALTKRIALMEKTSIAKK